MTQGKTQALPVLDDRSPTGKARPWAEHKTGNQLLSAAYDLIDVKKAQRLRECAEQLFFARTAEGLLRLVSAWFCRVRLCPLCAWRRALKNGAQMHQIFQDIRRREIECSYLFCTFTVRNVQGEELNKTLDQLNKAFVRMIQKKAVSDISLGWYKAIEITHDPDQIITPERYRKNPKYYAGLDILPGDLNPGFDSYHPHIHAIFAVPNTYFKDRKYLNQKKWTKLWQDALRVDYTPVVHVKKTGDTAADIAEAAKYSVKSEDYIIPDDWDLTVDTVRLLDKVLNKRRFLGLGGLFKEVAKDLKLQDVESDKADLVNVDGQAPEVSGEEVFSYVWYSGYRQYVREWD